jgi:hypothetical protein
MYICKHVRVPTVRVGLRVPRTKKIGGHGHGQRPVQYTGHGRLKALIFRKEESVSF